MAQINNKQISYQAQICFVQEPNILFFSFYYLPNDPELIVHDKELREEFIKMAFYSQKRG